MNLEKFLVNPVIRDRLRRPLFLGDKMSVAAWGIRNELHFPSFSPSDFSSVLKLLEIVDGLVGIPEIDDLSREPDNIL